MTDAARLPAIYLGAATDPGAAPDYKIEGSWLGLAKRSLEVE